MNTYRGFFIVDVMQEKKTARFFFVVIEFVVSGDFDVSSMLNFAEMNNRSYHVRSGSFVKS